MFHQIEGLAVDSDITFCDFTGTIELFREAILRRKREDAFPPQLFSVHRAFRGIRRFLRLLRRQAHGNSGGTCGKCKGFGWIELFGAGHGGFPLSMAFVNYDPKKSQRASRLASASTGLPCSSTALMIFRHSSRRCALPAPVSHEDSSDHDIADAHERKVFAWMYFLRT